ncbi:MAG TPA: SMI1/KNR4 family protein [Pirellulales bacterium]
MASALSEFLGHRDVGKQAPADESEIEAVSRGFNAPLPDALVAFWQASNGATLDRLNAHLLGTQEVLSILDARWNPFTELGFVPLLDDHQSNLICVIVREPVAFRVARVPHDDGSRLLYRDFDSFLNGLLEALRGGTAAVRFFHGSEGDYPADAPRSADDQASARALLQCDNAYDEWNYAVQLLDASNLDEWAALLETDHFVRRNVRARMQRMSAPAIRELLQQDAAEFRRFAQATAKAARQAGLPVGRQQDDALQVGNRWMSLEAFFHRRRIPNAFPRMVQWFEDLVAQRDPRARAGNFMTD